MADAPATKVVGLRGFTPPGEPVLNVVEVLEDLLAQAMAGDLRAIAFATVRRDGTTGTGWEKAEGGEAVAISLESHALGNAILGLAVRYAGGGG